MWSAPSGGSETVYRARTFWCLSSRAGSMPAGGTPTFDFFLPMFFLIFYFSSPCYVFSNSKLRFSIWKRVLLVLKHRLGKPLAVRDCALVLYIYSYFGRCRSVECPSGGSGLSIGPAPSVPFLSCGFDAGRGHSYF